MPAASISPELYASGMFAHMAGNEARWGGFRLIFLGGRGLQLTLLQGVLEAWGVI